MHPLVSIDVFYVLNKPLVHNVCLWASYMYLKHVYHVGNMYVHNAV